MVTSAMVMLLGSSAHAATYTVNVGPDNTFSPAQLTVSPGDTVVWEWSGIGLHDVVSGAGPTDPNMGVEFNSGIPAAAPKTFSHTFNSVGTFDYFCTPHFAFGMIGSVNVVEGGATYFVEVGPEFSFSPAQLTVSPGDTVVWEWSGLMTHDVVSGVGPTDPNMGAEFSSGIAAAGPRTFIHTFDSAGSFDYFCTPHFAFGMIGVIDVVSGGIAVPSMDTWALLFSVLLIGMLGLSWSRRLSKA